MARVAALRQMASDAPELALAVRDIKQIQANRFAFTYRDLLDTPAYSDSANFFLQELYSARDYSQRDAQFSRIAGALELTFPEQVVTTAVALADLHRRTEELDLALAQHWLQARDRNNAARYVASWRQLGQRTERLWQLESVLNIGYVLSELTRKRGLRLMLKMMHRPAELAGLGALQAFLESGFDNFRSMNTHGGSVDHFLTTVKRRETAWMDLLFDPHVSSREAHIMEALT
jgi:hypothetical protein